MRRYAATSRSKAEGFADLLGWSVLADEGLVAMRAGEFVAGYWASPPDASSSSPESRAQMAAQANAALRAFGTGWSVWSDVAVVPSSGYPDPAASHFPDPVSRALDEERRRQFMAQGAHYESERALLLSYTPPREAVRRVGEAMYRDGKAKRSPLTVAQEAMARALGEFEDHVADALGLRRMTSYEIEDGAGGTRLHDELVDYLAYQAYGTHFPLVLPRDGAFLDAVLGGEDFTPGHTPLLGQQYLSVVAIDGFPAESTPGILDRLTSLELPNGYRFSQRFIFRDPEDAVAEMKRARWMWSLAEVPFIAKAMGVTSAPVNQHAVSMRQSCDVALSLARENRVRWGFYSASVVLRHEDPTVLRDMARTAARRINEAGFHARVEDENATEAYFSSLAGHTEENVRRPMIHSMTLADLLPNTRVWTGSPVNPNPQLPPQSPPLAHARTEGGVPFRWNPSVGDNSNFIFFGPPGSGKTSLLNFTALQSLRYRGMRIRGVDYKCGMLVTANAVGGNHLEIGASGTPAFAPFAHLETEADMAAAEEWVAVCMQLQTSQKFEARGAVRRALENLRGKGREHRSVTDFNLAVQDKLVREKMGFYALGEGAGGAIFDGAADEMPNSHFDVYDITNIVSSGDVILLPALMCLLRTFERDEGAWPMLQLIDEAWAAIKSPLWKPRLRDSLKTKRSKGVWIGLATQNLSDVAKSDLLDVFTENVPTRVYGANEAAQLGGSGDEAGSADLYRAFGLTWQQREIIRTAEPKRQYYVSQGENHRLVDFGLGDLALALTTATHSTQVTAAKELIERHGDAWLRAHLSSRGLNYDALIG